MNTSTLFRAIGAVADEHRAAMLAVTKLRAAVSLDPTILLGTDVKESDVRDCRRNLDRTYLIRMFAEFETGLREFWKVQRKLRDSPRMDTKTLIDSVAARRTISGPTIGEVHKVRALRNAAVHGPGSVPPTGRVSSQPFEISRLRSSLCNFLKFLPHEW